MSKRVLAVIRFKGSGNQRESTFSCYLHAHCAPRKSCFIFTSNAIEAKRCLQAYSKVTRLRRDQSYPTFPTQEFSFQEHENDLAEVVITCAPDLPKMMGRANILVVQRGAKKIKILRCGPRLEAPTQYLH